MAQSFAIEPRDMKPSPRTGGRRDARIAAVQAALQSAIYTETVNRTLLLLGLALSLEFSLVPTRVLAQPAARPAAEQDDAEQEPPEEDDALKPHAEYIFNPLQAEKEMKIGEFYFKRGSFPAAALRFEEATKWNPGLAEAWRRLGEAKEKLQDSAAAADAYAKFVELAPESKQAAAAKKKVAELRPKPALKPAPRPATK